MSKSSSDNGSFIDQGKGSCNNQAVDIDENVQTWKKSNLQPAGQGQPADN